ncbi:MAG: hypothetical protein Q8936_15205 [Bacillota bacterium]|nr:hypothetical protein [Bacillota bacterium]
MKFEIKPYIGTEPILFGMTSEQIENDCGFTSHKFGIGIYAPFAQDKPGEPVEGVIVFAKGYYD